MPRKKGYGGLKHHDHREAGAEHLPHYDGRQTGDKGGKLKHYDGRSKVKETSKQTPQYCRQRVWFGSHCHTLDSSRSHTSHIK